MAAVTGLLTALTMPIIGAIVDHTKYRWDVGAWTAFLLIFINGIQICVGPSTWFFVALLQVAAGYLYTCHSVVTYAYMPELTSNKDELAVMASSFNMWQFFAETVYLLVVVVVSIVGSLDDITAAKFSQTMICLISLVLLGFSWIYLFGPRPALHEVPSGSSLVRVGFTRMRTTYNELKADFGEIRKFLLAMAFAEAGASAFASIAITYLVEVLGMESSETGIVFLTTLMFGVPGSLWARHLMLKVGTEKAYKGALMWWGTVTCLAPFFMNKPEQSGNAYIIGILWGIGFGWLYPTQRTTYCLLIPGGQESELMGLYIFAGQIIVWFPPLMFSILVTNNIPMPYGLGLCCGLFFYIALVITMFIDFESGFDKAKESVHLRQMGEDAGGSGSTGELEAGESAAAKLGPKPDRNSSNML
ncbi:hypothetical protein ScalyP_jg6030 [Parmales sp. scaly parma]|nr:hypothetical protein ScalyP_jg6030 [Parmales sp. scaly parma]